MSVRFKNAATTVESVWESLRGLLPYIRLDQLLDLGTRAWERRPAPRDVKLDLTRQAVWAALTRGYARANLVLRGHLPAVLVLLLGVLFSATAFLLTQNFYQNRSQQAFERPAAHYTAVLSQAFDRYLQVVNSAGAFMAASNEVDRWEFLALAERSLSRAPRIQALEWVPRVPAKKRHAYEKQGETDGLYGFRFTEKDTLGNTVPARDRDEYFPIYFVEPFERNQAALGFDLGSNPESRRLLDLARDSGRMIGIQQATSFHAADDREVFLTALPIFNSKTELTSAAERREALVGFVLGAFQFSELIEAARRDFASADALEIYLYDEAASPDDRLIYFHPSPLREDDSTPLLEEEVYEGLHKFSTYEVAGRQWSIVVKPIPGTFGSDGGLVSWSVMTVGLLLTALLLQHLMSSINRTQVIEQSVTQRTSELVESNQALEAEIQERKRAEQERMALERELAQIQKMESLGTLAGGIAHEINSPVQYVGENLQFLRDCLGGLSQVLNKHRALAEAARSQGVLMEQVSEVDAASESADLDFLKQEMPASIEQSLEGVDRISKIVCAIREFSHPDAKEKTAVDLNHAITTTLTVASNQIKYVADVETDFDADLPPVNCLPGEFNQVILNLLVNAAHAMEDEAGDQRGRITISTRNRETYVEIRVSDTGAGIPPENRERIFDPFFTTKEPGKGTGQGLAISHTIITKKHGGTISVESEVGEGTTFIITLPLDGQCAS